MKKFSMGMMLSSLLLIPVGCGEEAPPAPATPDPSAMMGHAADAAGHAVDGAADKAGAAVEGTADAAGAAVEGAADKAGAAVEGAADAAGAAVDSAKEAVKDAAP
jgi:hypothetical protein